MSQIKETIEEIPMTGETIIEEKEIPTLKEVNIIEMTTIIIIVISLVTIGATTTTDTPIIELLPIRTITSTEAAVDRSNNMTKAKDLRSSQVSNRISIQAKKDSIKIVVNHNTIEITSKIVGINIKVGRMRKKEMIQERLFKVVIQSVEITTKEMSYKEIIIMVIELLHTIDITTEMRTKREIKHQTPR